MNNLKKMLKLANEIQVNLENENNLKQFSDLSDKIFLSIYFPDSEIISGLENYKELYQELYRAVQESDLNPKIKKQIEHLVGRSLKTADRFIEQVRHLDFNLSALQDDKYVIDDVIQGKYLEEDL